MIANSLNAPIKLDSAVFPTRIY